MSRTAAALSVPNAEEFERAVLSFTIDAKAGLSGTVKLGALWLLLAITWLISLCNIFRYPFKVAPERISR